MDDTAELADVLDALASMGKDVTLPEGYDDSFFAANRLVLVPMQSGSGSMRYEVTAEFDGELITITLTGKMPEAGTADMADWLVLVPLSRTEYPAGYQIDLLTDQSAPGTGDVEVYDK